MGFEISLPRSSRYSVTLNAVTVSGSLCVCVCAPVGFPRGPRSRLTFELDLLLHTGITVVVTGQRCPHECVKIPGRFPPHLQQQNRYMKKSPIPVLSKPELLSHVPTSGLAAPTYPEDAHPVLLARNHVLGEGIMTGYISSEIVKLVHIVKDDLCEAKALYKDSGTGRVVGGLIHRGILQEERIKGLSHPQMLPT